ncbi:E3 ubiquitin-protein ligase RNF13-like isoform X2 [Hetaerina americana]|uniref:E3 ubiquitin-protein ligase RNF13-like isoform X2 n=1 Tax=Hetaerina americana TaxID=62018 RepID=UPI003A7F4F03
MFPERGGESGGGRCSCSMRPLPRHITALYTAMVISLMVMFHVALVGADVLVYSQATRHPVEGVEFPDAPARFGAPIPMDGIRGMLVYANPEDACKPMDEPPRHKLYSGKWFVLIKRYGCKFEDKVMNAMLAGYDAAIVHNVNSSSLEPMPANHQTNITIPSIFVGEETGILMKKTYQYNMGYYIFINDNLPFNINSQLLLSFAIVVGIFFLVLVLFMVVKCIKDRIHNRRHRLPSSSLKKIPVVKFKKNDPTMGFELCAICLEDYLDGDKLRVLPCAHAYHCKCIDPWLTCNRRVCPMCKRKVFASDERVPSDDDDDDDYSVAPRAEVSRSHAVATAESSEDEHAPLIRGGSTSQPSQSRRGRGNPRSGGTFRHQRENPFRQASRNPFNRLAGRESPEHPWVSDSSSAYSTSSSVASVGPHSSPANASEESRVRVPESAPTSDALVDVPEPNSSSPRMSVNSSRDEVQDVAVLPQDQQNNQRERSWWWSLWSMVVDV